MSIREITLTVYGVRAPVQVASIMRTARTPRGRCSTAAGAALADARPSRPSRPRTGPAGAGAVAVTGVRPRPGKVTGNSTARETRSLTRILKTNFAARQGDVA
ncbi:hypothetical protein GCM10027203_01300 [Nonomuraea fastidiosa]